MTSKIEWLRSADGRPGYTINPVKGLCPMACPYCYARRMYKRFGWNPEIKFDQTAFNALPPGPCKVFVGSTMELFGSWVKPEWLTTIFSICQQHPEKTFIFLTKQPQNLAKWSPFPENVWVGASATDWMQFSNAIGYLAPIQLKAKVKFISFEPLLERIQFDKMQELLFRSTINWLIIGQQTPIKPSTMPKIEWVREIVDAADRAGAPVFLKNNLLELVNYEGTETAFAFNKKDEYRQEFPHARP